MTRAAKSIMGVLVQREFTVAMDDRTEFERQSRLGVWERPIAVPALR